MSKSIFEEYVQSGEEPEIIPAHNGIACDVADYSGLTEIAETLVRGSHVVSVIGYTFDNAGALSDSIFFRVSLHALSDWTTIDALTPPLGALVSTFWTLDVETALEIAARTVTHIVSQSDLII